MAIDPNEKLVYSSRTGMQPFWWQSGLRVPPPPSPPRNLLWPMPDEHGSVLVVTLDLRDCKLYARFEQLDPETEVRLICW
jgi:hypothetical protein